MTDNMYEVAELLAEKERAVVVRLILPGQAVGEEDPLEELAALVDTAGAEVVGKLVQRSNQIHARHFIGSGKAQELAELCLAQSADLVIFDHDLSPAQARNLEKLTKARVITRTELILDIFARRARTHQARIQVELAQLKYQLPRLRRMWTHLSRIEGGIGLRGPGETQLEVDRRHARTRIADLETQLTLFTKRKQVVTEGRRDIYAVALVGYTNVGKSSLMNALTGTEIFVENRLFATLDATTRSLPLANGQTAVLTDTVGFIRDIPHDLVASFHATLEEMRQADLLLHVVDVSNPRWSAQVAAVNQVLTELDSRAKPTLLVLNKCDLLPPDMPPDAVAAQHDHSYAVSARTGYGLEPLRAAIERCLTNQQTQVEIRAHAGDGRLLAFLAEHGRILRQEYTGDEVNISAVVPPRHAARLRSQFPDATVQESDQTAAPLLA